jgi:acyl carrier protein
MTTEQKLKQIFGRQFDVDPGRIGPDTSPKTLGGWDSTKHVDLILEIEDEFGITFESTDLLGLNSFGNILQLLEDKLQSA